MSTDQSERIAALEREVEALRADAERYRWLVQNSTREVSHIGDLGLHFNCDFDNWDNVDAAIDAARSKT